MTCDRRTWSSWPPPSSAPGFSFPSAAAFAVSLCVAQGNLKMEGMCYRERTGREGGMWGGLCGKQGQQSQLSPKRWPIKTIRPVQGTKVPDVREVVTSLLHCVSFQTGEAGAVCADVRAREKTVSSREFMGLASKRAIGVWLSICW